MRRPSESRLRTLSAVGDGRVRMSGTGWEVSAQPAGTAASALRDARRDGWISVPYVPTDPHESVKADLTDDGRAVLARYWPEWTPR